MDANFGACRDYSGLSVLKAALSSSEGPSPGFSQFWIYGNDVVHQRGDDATAFLLVNGGAATLSASPLGTVSIKDVVTRREVQSLKHDGTSIYTPDLVSTHDTFFLLQTPRFIH